MKAQPQQLALLKVLLKFFGDLSGLRLNISKFKFLTTCSTTQQTQQLADVLGCKASEFPFNYLGMPLSNRKLQKIHYMPPIQKVSNKLSKWKASLLSIGGKLTLIKATLSTIPIYMMTAFLLPKWGDKRNR